MISAREAALKALAAYRRSGAWSSLFLKNLTAKEGLERRDSALASNICAGVLQNMYLCDFYIASYSSIKPEKIEPIVLDILRLSVYQLIFLDRIPHSAAVNEAVALCKKYSNRRSAGFVTAVLRKISSEADHLPEPDFGTEIKNLSVKYSHPEWLVEELADTLGTEECEELLKLHNTAPETFLQVNTTMAETDAVFKELSEHGCRVSIHPWLRDCLVISGGGVESLPGFAEGKFYVQDPAARLAVTAADPRDGDIIIDGCAAPGGKSFAAAIAMCGRGRVISCDIHENKLGLIRSGAERLRLGIIETLALDARRAHAEISEKADVVIADVPCSGIGVIRKKPEIRYKRKEDIAGLPRVQLDILESLSACVKPGGVLLYSTCTLLESENREVVESFLASHGDFSTEAFTLPHIGETANGMITLFPHMDGTDGFFICKMRRK